MHSSREYQGREEAFLSEQCKEIKENNRMGKTRDLFNKIRDTKGTFHARQEHWSGLPFPSPMHESEK